MPDIPPFWKQKTLAEMTLEEWESLCDGCGWCCLYKLENEETNEIVYTRVACRLLNLKTCRCMDYADRARVVPTCVQISCENIYELTWLPETCAYRRLALGKDLPQWNYLLSGSRIDVHKARASVLGIAISEYGVDLDDLDAYILEPDEGD